MSTLRFVLRQDKKTKANKCAIELVYQIAGDRKKMFLGDKVNEINWSSEHQSATYVAAVKAKKILDVDLHKSLDLIVLTEAEVAEVNQNISDVRKAIRDAEKRFELDKVVYSAQMVIDVVKTARGGKIKKEEPKNLLFDFIDQYINEHTASRVKGSLGVYKSVKAHLQAYQLHTKHKVRFDSIDYSFFQRFQNYLIEHRNINNTTIAKALSTLKTFLGYARQRGIKVNDNYRDFKIKREKLEVIALTQEELDAIIKTDLKKNEKLKRVRDIFCFSCATGLRFSDLEQLKWEHVNAEEIRLIVKKTKTELIIPLNTISAGILAKYKGMSRPLPMISGQKLNVYIKDLCEEAGVSTPIEIVRFRGARRVAEILPKHKLIHIHTGRKTFVTLSLEKGMSAEQVMAITGHSDYKSFKRYVDITKKLTKTVMVKAWGAPN